MITDVPAFPDLYREVHGGLPSGESWDALNWLTSQTSELAYAAFAPRGTPEAALKLRRHLAREHNIEVPVFVFEDALWLRVSAQIYNERGDYERLASVLGKLLDQ